MATTTKMLLQFGDGADPETFSNSCTINTQKDFTLTATMTEATEPDCDDPDSPSWVVRAVDTLSAGISGAGTMDPQSYAVLRAKMLAGESFDVRVKLDIPLASGGGWFQGSYVMQDLGLAKQGKGFVTATVTLQSNGEVTWTDASA